MRITLQLSIFTISKISYNIFTPSYNIFTTSYNISQHLRYLSLNILQRLTTFYNILQHLTISYNIYLSMSWNILQYFMTLSCPFQVKEKMDEVKDMLDGTKTSVDNLLPKSEEIFNQVRLR